LTATFGLVQLTEANLKYDHFYLASISELFPSDSIGGGNESESGVPVEVHSGIEQPVMTDIAGDKMIFRRRAWVREFFETHNLAPGDTIVVERTRERRFHVYPARASAI
jgi:hypothetical protein